MYSWPDLAQGGSSGVEVESAKQTETKIVVSRSAEIAATVRIRILKFIVANQVGQETQRTADRRGVV